MTGFGRYALAVTFAAVMIGGLGSLVPGAVARGVWLGAAVGAVTQIVGIWVIWKRIAPRDLITLHGLGMVLRVVALGMVALPLLRSPAEFTASTLFAMVALFLVSTVMEPLFLRIELLKRR